MASVRLVKTQKVRLVKGADGGKLQNVTAGMGWSPSGGGSHSWDLDQTLVVMSNGRFVKEISYRHGERSREFYYHGDDLTGGSGKGKEDDEMIDINFSMLDESYDRIIVIMNIYQAYYKSQDLSMVRNAYIHLWDVDARKDLVEYPIENTDKFRGKTGMIVGEFYKDNGVWEFQAVGEPMRVRDISEMVDIIKQKYSNIVTTEQSWEEFLDRKYSYVGTQGNSFSGNATTNSNNTSNRPRRSFVEKILDILNSI